MAGEGWLPFLSRKYDDLSSYAGDLYRRTVPTTPTPSPQFGIRRRPDINLPVSEPSYDPVKPLGVRAGESLLKTLKPITDITKDPYGALKNVWKSPEAQATRAAVQKPLNAISEASGRATGAALDVYNPNNTGSEHKQSDIGWEALKGLKSGFGSEEPTTPAHEFVKRHPLEGGDPIAKGVAGFGLNALVDPTNLIEPGLKAGASLGHLAGMAPEMARAWLPAWQFQKLNDIERFGHGVNYSGDTEKMMKTGFQLRSGSDYLQDWVHAGAISKPRAEEARLAGKVPQSKLAKQFAEGGNREQMPVKLLETGKVMDLKEPVPLEDIQPIIDSMHPVFDAQARKKVWEKYKAQEKYVVPHEDIRAGKVSPLPIARDPRGLKAVQELERVLIDPGEHPQGIFGARYQPGQSKGQAPLNHPSIPTDYAGIRYHDLALQGGRQVPENEAMAFNPLKASVSNPEEDVPYQPLGVYGGGTFPKNKAPDLSVGAPVAKAPGPVQTPQAQATAWAAGNTPAVTDAQIAKMKAIKAAEDKVIAAKKLKSATFTGPTKEAMGTHLNDIKSIFEDHGIDYTDDLFDTNNYPYGSTPESIHKDFVKHLNSLGHDKAADDVTELWIGKEASQAPSSHFVGGAKPPTAKVQSDHDAAYNFHWDFAISHDDPYNPNAKQQMVTAWNNLSPEAKDLYTKNFPMTYAGLQPDLIAATMQVPGTPAGQTWKNAPNLKQAFSQEEVEEGALAFDQIMNNPGITDEKALELWESMDPSIKMNFSLKYPENYKNLQNMQMSGYPLKSNTAVAQAGNLANAQTTAKTNAILDKLALDASEGTIANHWKGLSPAEQKTIETHFPKEFGQIQDAIKLDELEAKEAADFDFDFQGGNEPEPDWNQVGKIGQVEQPKGPKTYDQILNELLGSGFEPEEAVDIAQQTFKEQNLPSALPAGIPGFEESTVGKKLPWEDTPQVSDTFMYTNKYPYEEGTDLNGVEMRTIDKPPNFFKSIDYSIDEPAFAVPPGKSKAAGVVITEPDGRVWIVESKGHHAGYKHVFPKGTVDPGESLQFAAAREAFEESGLHVKITGHLTDAEGPGSVTRFYTGERIGGAPWAHGSEIANVKLVPIHGQKIEEYLQNIVGDETAHHGVLDILREKQAGIGKPGEVGYPGVKAKAQVETRNKDFQLTTEHAEDYLGGVHPKHIYTKNGQQYLFKPAPVAWVAEQEVTANKIAELAGLHPVDISVETVNGKTGSMQAAIGNKFDWPSLAKQDLTKLTTSELRDIIKHHPVDWLTANHDAHPGQFLKTPNGIVEIDRGRAFKDFGTDKLSPDYSPTGGGGFDDPIYNKIQKLYKAGKLPQLKNKDIWGALDETIINLENNEGDIENLMQDALERSGKTNQYQTAQNRLYHIREDIIKFWTPSK